MQLLICPEIPADNGKSVPLSGLFSDTAVAGVVWDKLCEKQCRMQWGPLQIVSSPRCEKAACLPRRIKSAIIRADQLEGLDSEFLLIHNFRFITNIPSSLFQEILDVADADVIAICASPRLTAFSETPRIVERLGLVGISRPYANNIEPVSEMMDWPHHILIRKSCCRPSGIVSADKPFQEWLQVAAVGDKPPLFLEVGGIALDLNQESGLLSLLEGTSQQQASERIKTNLGPSVRVFGDVVCGSNIDVAPGVVLAGPVGICDHVKIGSGAIVQNAIIGSSISIPSGSLVKNRVLWNQSDLAEPCPEDCDSSSFLMPPSFRCWPWWSYVRLGKRLIDILFSLAVLIICLPIFLIVFIVIKLTSPGPVFYRARRQGRHGKEFDCLKFRTMILKADALQDRLRAVNQVDGPQFKIGDDPRITGIGKFLRETCIDEIPQFINVLLGQMSVIGPRPSPEEENRSCPPWRDARLSVRPGITGLWQICRTRRAGMDFQEWVYFDTEYVRSVSLWMDVKICFRTVMHLVHQFLAQFG